MSESGCCVMVLVVIGLLYLCCCSGPSEKEKAAERERKEAERRAAIEEYQRAAEEQRLAEEAARREAERRVQAKEDKLRTFALRQAPSIWQTEQALKGEIENQNKRIAELEKAFEDFGRNPREDSDYARICELRDEMVRSAKTLRTKMEDAYLASIKFDATPAKSEYANIMRKALEEGIQEAEAASNKFKEMRSNK